MEETTAASYARFLSMNQLRDTKQRRLIFKTFMEQHEHLTAEDLYHILQKSLPQIGQATVYRTLKLLCENGLAHELALQTQGIQGAHTQSSYFEPADKSKHHDHLVCLQCGKHYEFHSEALEELQEKIAAEHSFELLRHTHVLYGNCRNCQS